MSKKDGKDSIKKDDPTETSADVKPVEGVEMDASRHPNADGVWTNPGPLNNDDLTSVTQGIARINVDDVTPPPLPLEGYRLTPTTCSSDYTPQQKCQLESLTITWDRAREIEQMTRTQSENEDWHRERKLRITSSYFRRVCHVRSGNEEKLAREMKKGSPRTAAMRRGLELEPDALTKYSQERKVKYWRCGLVIHPDAPWLGTSPDGVVFDANETTQFGLVEIKCPDVQNYAECDYLKQQDDGTRILTRSHPSYWQVQGQLLLTGMEWCDFVVCAREDMFVERIRRDDEVFKTIREKGDLFFFNYYLNESLRND